MRVLVVGSGGREHALAWKLAQEAEVICAPGNPGMSGEIECVPVRATDIEGILGLARNRNVELVVVGPEDPLVLGLADILRGAGILVFGPGAAAARLEGSKAFSKQLMTECGVPTAAFETFTDPDAAAKYARGVYASGGQLAVKASGTALGRGVTVAGCLQEAEEAIRQIMVERKFGQAGETVVLEERLIGREFSLLTLIGDKNYVSLPIAQDYKRALDHDEGDNTGGMGAFSPCEWAHQALVADVESSMVTPVVDRLRREGIPFRGNLFTGVMVTSTGPKCLEYNVRFGDPETQTVMMRLGDGFLDALRACAAGEEVPALQVLPHAVVTVVVASRGYPNAYKKGVAISLEPLVDGSVKRFFAGVTGEPSRLVNSGGRVVAVSALGATLPEARAKAYDAASGVRFEGCYFRTDIASG